MAEAPNSKLQHPEKHQASSFNRQRCQLPLSWFDVWNFSGAWMLGLGAFRR
jgi:hypothetical protein